MAVAASRRGVPLISLSPYTPASRDREAAVAAAGGASGRWSERAAGDANSRVEPPEPSSISAKKILPSLWNKEGLGAWRKDLDPPPVSEGAPGDVPMADV